MKNTISRRTYKFQKVSEFWIFWTTLFHSITVGGKKKFYNIKRRTGNAEDVKH